MKRVKNDRTPQSYRGGKKRSSLTQIVHPVLSTVDKSISVHSSIHTVVIKHSGGKQMRCKLAVEALTGLSLDYVD